MSSPTINIGLPAKPAAPQVNVPQIQVGGMGGAVSAPQKKTFLEKLKGNVVGPASKAPPPIIRIRGSKGTKTIAAVAVDLEEESGFKKTPGLPRPPGSRVVVVSFDNNSENSLKGHYANSKKFAESKVEVIHICRELGYDAGSSTKAIDVVDALMELLRDWRDSKPGSNIGLLVMDRWDLFTESVLKMYCYHKAGVPLGGQIDKGAWGPRSNKIAEALDLLPQAVLDGGFVVITGPRDVDEGREKLVQVNGKWAVGVQESKWSARIDHAVTVKLDLERAVVKGREGEEIRHAVCTMSYHTDLFKPWTRVVLDGRHLGAFLDKDAHLDTIQEVLNIGPPE